MQLNLSEILNIHAGKECVIVGPAIDKKKDEYLKNFEGVKISIGDTFTRLKKVKFDYILCCNGEFLNPFIKDQLDLINQSHSTFIFSDVECYRNVFRKDHKFLKENLKVNFFVYDQRHIDNKKCFPEHNCCQLIKDKDSIFKIVGEHFDVDYSDCKSGGTVFEIALLFALLFGCNQIHTYGVTLISNSKKYKSYVGKNKKIEELIFRGRKKIRKELQNYYFEKKEFYPYLVSAFNKIYMYLFNKTEISLDQKQMTTNIKFSCDIAEKNKINLIYHDEKSYLKNFKQFRFKKNFEDKKTNEIKLIDLVDKHKNEECIIVGGSKKMHDFDYENFEGKIIVVGTAVLRLKNRFKPDYLVSANNHFPVPEIKTHLEILNKYKNMTWLFSDSALYGDIWNKSEDFLEENLKIKYLAYDERHFEGKPCKKYKKCCDFLKTNPERANIFNYLTQIRNLNIDEYVFSKGASVAEPALAFAILMGFKKIRIQGVDIPLDKEYKLLRKASDKYFGYSDNYADSFLKNDYLYLRRKHFQYYLKKKDFSEYIYSLYIKTKLFLNGKSEFSINFKRSMMNFSNLAKIAKIKNQKIRVLNKESSLNKLKEMIN
tara:strand:- start:14522 stop:16318 length:1797 start_codon:yes stop_codon:yes gene_type:complete